jgi:ABC-type transport system involved in cytochrome c biogenesis permease component
MIRTLFWKEYREQRMFAVLLVALAGLLVAVLPFAAPTLKISSQDVAAVRQGILILFAVLSGLVGGAQHWAAERENGTESLLDMMPVPRSVLWRTKTAYVFVQWTLQMIAFAAIGFATALIGPDDTVRGAYVFLGLSAVWLTATIGTSAYTRTVLGSIGRSVPYSVLAPIIVMSVFVIIVQFLHARTGGYFSEKSPGATFLGIPLIVLTIGFPLWIGYRRITAVDRERGFVGVPSYSPRIRALRTAWSLAHHDVPALSWPIGALMGLMFLFASQEPNLLWLLIGAVLGAWLGVSVIDSEKQGGAFKMWADQRLPADTLWYVKTGHRLAILVLCTILYVMVLIGAMYVAYDLRTSPNRSFAAMWTAALSVVTPITALLFLGPLFGFSSGLLFSLITPKKIISVVGAALAGIALTIFWLPMVGSGGLRWWQWIGVPVVLFATSRVLVWPWVSGRLTTRVTLAGLVVPLLVIAVYWLGVEQARISKIPKLAPLFDEAAFMGVMNSSEAAKAGDRLTEVAREVLTLRDEAVVMDQFYGGPGGLVSPSTVQPIRSDRPNWTRFSNAMQDAFNNGLSGLSPEIIKATDHMLTGEWIATIEKLVAEDVEYANLGAVDNLYAGYDPWHDKRQMLLLAGELLLYDALKKDAAGDAAGALVRIDHALRMSRWVGHRVSSRFRNGSGALQFYAIDTLNFWTFARTSKADVELLLRANEMIDRHRARSDMLADDLKSGYLVNRAYISNPDNLMKGWYLTESLPNSRGPWSALSLSIWKAAIGIDPEIQRRLRIYDYWFAGLLKSMDTDHRTLHAMTEARGSTLSPDYRFGRRPYNFADWVTPLIQNPSPLENENEWQKASTVFQTDIEHQNSPFFWTQTTARAVARDKAFFDMMKVANMVRAYRILHGEWPESLTKTEVPGFGPVPKNPMTGEPFQYEARGDSIVLRAPDLFPTQKDPKPRKGFHLQHAGQSYAIEFDIPSFVVK